jgi:hypothetical protein
MTEQAISPLRRRMIEGMSIRKFAAKTQHNWVRKVKDCILFRVRWSNGSYWFSRLRSCQPLRWRMIERLTIRTIAPNTQHGYPTMKSVTAQSELKRPVRDRSLQ